MNQLAFRTSERFRNWLSPTEPGIEALHQVKRERVVDRPQRRNYTVRARKLKCTGERADAFFAKETAGCSIASRKHNQICIQAEIHDLASLQDPVFACGWITHHDERRSVRVAFIGDGVYRKVDHSLPLQIGVFESRLRCPGPDQPRAVPHM